MEKYCGVHSLVSCLEEHDESCLVAVPSWKPGSELVFFFKFYFFVKTFSHLLFRHSDQCLNLAILQRLSYQKP